MWFVTPCPAFMPAARHSEYSLSTGTVTFLLADIEDSTRLWEAQPTRMAGVLARHDALCREVVVERRGRVVKTTGDGLYAAFDDPFEALSAAIEWFVELAALADPSFVPHAVATELGIADEAGVSITDTLVRHLASRRLLLVLDNAEHLLNACAQLVDLVLRRCRDVKVAGSL